jgi:hypothetical protein
VLVNCQLGGRGDEGQLHSAAFLIEEGLIEAISRATLPISRILGLPFDATNSKPLVGSCGTHKPKSCGLMSYRGGNAFVLSLFFEHKSTV